MLTNLSNNLCVTDLTEVPSGNLYESVSAIMSGRFQLLMNFFHLNNAVNKSDCTSNDYDMIYKIKPLLDLVIKAFQSVYESIRNHLLMRA